MWDGPPAHPGFVADLTGMRSVLCAVRPVVKKVVTFIIVLLLLAGGFVWHYSAAASHQHPSFRSAHVTRGDLRVTISATGTIEPEEVVDVGAQVAGMIKTFGRDLRDANKAIDYGSPVEEGTLLAQIDDAVYKAQVSQAKATLGRAE